MRDEQLRFRRRVDQYQDRVARLFPELFKGLRDENGKRILCRTVTFQVTDACNLACTYCYQINKGVRRMSLDVAKKFIDMLLTGEKGMKDYINEEYSPFIIIEFIGGEPFLEVDLIEQIIRYFIDECIRLNHPWATRHRFSICSNGTLYRDPKVQAFLNRYSDSLSFSVTLDGNKELHDSCRIFPNGKGSYDLAYDACIDWMDRGYYMGSKITIAPGNVGELYGAILHMISLGYKDIMANCVFEEGWTIEHAGILYDQMKKIADYIIENDLLDDLLITLFDEDSFVPLTEGDDGNWCGGTGLMLAVDPDGYLYPCIRYMESSLGNEVPPLRIGDVETGIGICKEHCDTISCLNCITRRSQSTDECYYCPIARGCAWCSGYNYQMYGTADKRATFICIMHKARALGNAYLFSRWYEKYYPDKKYKLYLDTDTIISIIGEEEYETLINSPNIMYDRKVDEKWS